MKTHSDKKQDGGQRTSINTPQTQNSQPTFQFVNNRPEALLQRKLQTAANNSPQNQYQQTIQQMADNHAAQKPTIQKKENKTGMPDNLKSGIENLSGYSMDDVKVHYNSDKPAQLQAHAYAQGTDIHLGPGQEKHLPHEAWHVVQQKQGRVKPTMQMKGKVNINDDEGLEKEADVMGAKALQMKSIDKDALNNQPVNIKESDVTQLVLATVNPQNGPVNLEQAGGGDAFIIMRNPTQHEGNDVSNAIGFTGVLNAANWANLGKSPNDYWRAHGYAKSFGGAGNQTNVGWWSESAESEWTNHEQKVRGAGLNQINSWLPGTGERGTYLVERKMHRNIGLKDKYIEGLMAAVNWAFADEREAWQRVINNYCSDVMYNKKEKEKRMIELGREKTAAIAGVNAQTKITTWVNALFGNPSLESNLIKEMKMTYAITTAGVNKGNDRGSFSKKIKSSAPNPSKFGLLDNPAAIWRELVNANEGVFGHGASPTRLMGSRINNPAWGGVAMDIVPCADGWGYNA